MVMEEAYGLCL